MPIFSLPSKYGIGDFGKTSYNFVDFLKKAGQKFWQILPLVQTGYGNSPYSSVCSTSFNPYFISLEQLKQQGLLQEQEVNQSLCRKKYVDYDFLEKVRLPLLRKAFSRYDKSDKKFLSFIKSKRARNYALYMTFKDKFNQKPFYDWEDKFKLRNATALKEFENQNKQEVYFWQFVQFIAREQWIKLKTYANQNGIQIIGDMPLYVALDSVDVWENPKLYKLNKDFTPRKVAGVPPDYFCSDGQLWGNPVYDYAYHQKDGFKWWCNRLKTALEIYDYVRIDHFRGLDRYYEVEFGSANAKKGKWIKVPSTKLFGAIHKQVDKSRIIAEDLGLIDSGVRKLLNKVGYPGMKVLSFAFDGNQNNLYLPQNLDDNCVCYTGTHDNDTLVGLISSIGEEERKTLQDGVKNSLNIMGIEGSVDSINDTANAIINLGLKSKANLFIMPISDALFMDSSNRINVPGSVSKKNWAVRFSSSDFFDELAKSLYELNEQYDRL